MFFCCPVWTCLHLNASTALPSEPPFGADAPLPQASLRVPLLRKRLRFLRVLLNLPNKLSRVFCPVWTCLHLNASTALPFFFVFQSARFVGKNAIFLFFKKITKSRIFNSSLTIAVYHISIISLSCFCFYGKEPWQNCQGSFPFSKRLRLFQLYAV